MAHRCRTTCAKPVVNDERERTATPMARLRTPPSPVSIGLKMRSEGMGVRASGRVLDKSHSTILRWQQRVAQQEADWCPCAPAAGEVTLENAKLYTRVNENVPLSESEGWSMTCIERNSRDWVRATVGRRNEQLFEHRCDKNRPGSLNRTEN